VDFEEINDGAQNKSESHKANVKKNRITLIALFVMFMIPVALAYAAYFSGWFANATKNQGELIVEQGVLDIEDFAFKRTDGKLITGKEFETLYWWVLPLDSNRCDDDCLKLNLHTINQTYVGLGKKSERINQLLVLPIGTKFDIGDYPTAFSEFSNLGVKALEKTPSGLGKDLPSNYIYLVDPLGNIFMRYPLVRDKEKAADKSRDLRIDILRLFKYSRLG